MQRGIPGSLVPLGTRDTFGRLIGPKPQNKNEHRKVQSTDWDHPQPMQEVRHPTPLAPAATPVNLPNLSPASLEDATIALQSTFWHSLPTLCSYSRIYVKKLQVFSPQDSAFTNLSDPLDIQLAAYRILLVLETTYFAGWLNSVDTRSSTPRSDPHGLTAEAVVVIVSDLLTQVLHMMDIIGAILERVEDAVLRKVFCPPNMRFESSRKGEDREEAARAFEQRVLEELTELLLVCEVIVVKRLRSMLYNMADGKLGKNKDGTLTPLGSVRKRYTSTTKQRETNYWL